MKLHSRVCGYGPQKVMALHGWLSDSAVYDGIAPYLDPMRYTVAWTDYRGYGGSRGLSGDYSIAEIAADVLDTADALGWSRFHVMGHSMGGMVLQKAMLAAPQRVVSGIAITAVAASGFPLDAPTMQHFQSAAHDDAALASIFDTLTGQRHAPSVLRHWVSRTRERTTTNAFLGYLQAWTTTHFAPDVAVIAAPILAVAGAHDPALGPAYLVDTYLKQLRNVQQVVIDAAGHYPMLETPPELFKVIETFLQAQAKPA